jgi:enoyl-[acyl-carrier protein] reductase II
VGTRFLASEEASAKEGWKRRIVDSESEETVRFETWSAIMPPRPPGAYDVVPRVLRSGFVEEWETRRSDAAAAAERLQTEVMGAVREGRTHEVVAFTGQTAGLIRDVRPAADIVRDLVAAAERALEFR